MKRDTQAQLLRILIGEGDKYKGKMLYEAIVLKARELHLAGATVIRGIMGFGADTLIRSAKLLELSNDLPVIIEIADTEANINKLLPFLDEVVTDGLITIENVRIIKYTHNAG
ncbi:MAG: DUF190 domain-containing protein [Spirochaetes bacterium]|nr:DUF190 domain-containing protein [Spirochaetota bacterium]